MSSEEAVVEVFALGLDYLLVHCLFVLNLRLCFSELNVSCLHVGKLWLVKFIPEFKLIFEDRKVRSALLHGWDVFFGNLWLYFWGEYWLLLCFLYRWQVLVPCLLNPKFTRKCRLLCLKVPKCLLLQRRSYWHLLITEYNFWPFWLVHFPLLLNLRWRILWKFSLLLRRSVVLELLIHFSNLHLQLLKLRIDSQHRVKNWFVQIHVD